MRAQPDLTTIGWIRAGPAAPRGRASACQFLVAAVLAAADLILTKPPYTAGLNHYNYGAAVVTDRGRSQDC